MFNPVEKLYKYCPRCANKLVRKEVEKKARLYCEKCGFIFWNNPRPCASAIIEKNGGSLLIKRARTPLKGYWCLPGGVIEYDETPEQSVVREIKEEINLNIKIDRLIGVYLIDNDPRGNGIDVIYKASMKDGTFQLSQEHAEYNFFSPDRLPSPIAYKHKDAINDYFKSL